MMIATIKEDTLIRMVKSNGVYLTLLGVLTSALFLALPSGPGNGPVISRAPMAGMGRLPQALPNSTTASQFPSATEKTGPLLQVTAPGGQVLGFQPGSVVLGGSDHMPRVDFVGARAVAPVSVMEPTRSGEGGPGPLIV